VLEPGKSSDEMCESSCRGAPRAQRDAPRAASGAPAQDGAAALLHAGSVDSVEGYTMLIRQPCIADEPYLTVEYEPSSELFSVFGLARYAPIAARSFGSSSAPRHRNRRASQCSCRPGTCLTVIGLLGREAPCWRCAL
jgi:hypothetical protein